ncbi:MAG: D-alanyl-D-alanine dipeptidase, partial [Burkholderiaceae bacterium]|nr:D-alanyl-D-alanine dipeptidase [Burkholderiaceae bacterium]
MTHEFVDLAQHLSGLSVDARYSGPHNFMGRPAQGYLEPLCLLTTQAARRMGEVRGQARALGLDLLVFDGYRPQRAVDDFLRWVETPADAR